MTRRRIKITPILILLNVLVILFITCFYLARGIKYYKLENKTVAQNDETILSEYLEKKRSYVDLTKGLILNEEKNTYRYVGKVEDNYLLYSGILYRIVGIDNENNVKIVSDESVTLMYSGLEKGYNDSYINKWLNKADKDYSGEFYNTLYSPDKFLASTYMCNDIINDLQKITCDETNNDTELSILSVYDYSEAGGKDSYLNNGEVFYLNTLNKDKNNYFISSKGEIGLNSLTSKVYGVRPMLTIKSDTQLLSGKGTKTNPYIIEKHDVKKLSDVYVGSIVEFSGENYKVVSKSKDTIKIATTDYIIGKDKEPVKNNFSPTNNKYSTSSKTLGYYLNNDFYKTLKNQDYIVQSSWYIGANTLSNLDYSAKYTSKVNAKVGILSLGELFVGELKDTFTLTRGMEASNIINIINENGNLFGDLITSKHAIRPVLNIKSDISIKSGEGTEKKPYILGGQDNEKEEE